MMLVVINVRDWWINAKHILAVYLPGRNPSNTLANAIQDRQLHWLMGAQKGTGIYIQQRAYISSGYIFV